MPKTLQERLDAFRSGLIDRITPEKRDVLAAAEAEQLARDWQAGAPAEGDAAPDFTLPDQSGAPIRLAERLARGPVALLFFRGGWCPFCTLTLRAWQEVLPALRREGGSVLAVSPQPATGCAAMADRDMLDFRVLSDAGNRVAARYGVRNEIPEGLRPFYRKLGHDLPAINGTGDWSVPLPATFLIRPDGVIARAHLGPLPHQRLEPAEAVAVFRALRQPVG